MLKKAKNKNTLISNYFQLSKNCERPNGPCQLHMLILFKRIARISNDQNKVLLCTVEIEALQALQTIPDIEDPKRKKAIERKQKKYDARLKKRASSRPKARTERVTLDAVTAQTNRSSRVVIESEESEDESISENSEEEKKSEGSEGEVDEESGDEEDDIQEDIMGNTKSSSNTNY